MKRPAVRAAGGVTYRRLGGELEVVVVHRPKYDDWTLPKGKVAADERDEDCALREVEEETGLVCELGPELAGAAYRDAEGRPKSVRYWAMRPTGGGLRPAYEIDAAEWTPIAEARRLLSYDRDRRVLASFESLEQLQGEPLP